MLSVVILIVVAPFLIVLVRPEILLKIKINLFDLKFNVWTLCYKLLFGL
jgi:hypothetical protein